MRSVLAIIFLIGSFSVTALANSESDLRQYFEGKQVTFRIDMPATKNGINIYPERSQSLNYEDYNAKLKEHGAAIHRGEKAAVTGLRLNGRNIEVQFNESRFNIRFERVESWMLTPATVVDALNRYVEFTEADKESARLQESSEVAAGYVRQGVVHVGPKTTYLKEGLQTEEVVKLLGEPLSISEHTTDGKIVSTYVFERSEDRVLIAEFVSNLLVGSRTEHRANVSVIAFQ